MWIDIFSSEYSKQWTIYQKNRDESLVFIEVLIETLNFHQSNLQTIVRIWRKTKSKALEIRFSINQWKRNKHLEQKLRQKIFHLKTWSLIRKNSSNKWDYNSWHL